MCTHFSQMPSLCAFKVLVIALLPPPPLRLPPFPATLFASLFWTLLSWLCICHSSVIYCFIASDSAIHISLPFLLLTGIRKNSLFMHSSQYHLYLNHCYQGNDPIIQNGTTLSGYGVTPISYTKNYPNVIINKTSHRFSLCLQLRTLSLAASA